MLVFTRLLLVIWVRGNLIWSGWILCMVIIMDLGDWYKISVVCVLSVGGNSRCEVDYIECYDCFDCELSKYKLQRNVLQRIGESRYGMTSGWMMFDYCLGFEPRLCDLYHGWAEWQRDLTVVKNWMEYVNLREWPLSNILFDLTYAPIYRFHGYYSIILAFLHG